MSIYTYLFLYYQLFTFNKITVLRYSTVSSNQTILCAFCVLRGNFLKRKLLKCKKALKMRNFPVCTLRNLPIEDAYSMRKSPALLTDSSALRFCNLPLRLGSSIPSAAVTEFASACI